MPAFFSILIRFDKTVWFRFFVLVWRAQAEKLKLRAVEQVEVIEGTEATNRSIGRQTEAPLRASLPISHPLPFPTGERTPRERENEENWFSG